MAEYLNLFTTVQATGPLHHGIELDAGNSPRTGQQPWFFYWLGKLGNAQMATKEYHKAMETFKHALELEPDNAEAKDGYRRTVMKIQDANSDMKDDPERSKRALSDPEIQSILRDPMLNQILEDAKADPRVLERVMRTDVHMAAKIQKLIAAGILRIG